MTEFNFHEIPDRVADVAVGLDVDGTLSSTQRHMKGWENQDGQHVAGFNERLAEAFPEVEPYLDELVALRVAFRDEYGHLAHTEQSKIWGAQHLGYSFDSQFGFYFGVLPKVFTPQLRRAIRTWSRNPENFGYGEYDDVSALVQGLRALGRPAFLHTMGHDVTVEGGVAMPGWQRLKLDSSPTLRQFPQHIVSEVPEGGKGVQYSQWYNKTSETFVIPRTDRPGEFIEASSAVLVDDSTHNVLRMPRRTLGILIDRSNKYADLELPGNVRRIRTLANGPEIIAEFAEQDLKH